MPAIRKAPSPLIHLVLLAGLPVGFAADLPGGAEPAAAPVYEPIMLSTWYEVDPAWPKRPEHCTWDHVPGVAVDGKDQVWIFTRGTPPVQVYDAEGNFVRAWGTDLVGDKNGKKTSHQIRFDREGMIWLADTGKHIVMRVTPEGKLLKTLGTPNEPGDDERHFDKPTDVAFRSDGHIFVGDIMGCRVQKFIRRN